MSGSGVYRRKSVGGLWFCMFLVSTGFMHQQTMGATEVECLMHEDCKPGQFCAYVPNIDSYEGWRFATSTCKACSQCVCHFSSTTNRCPQERLVFYTNPFLQNFDCGIPVVDGLHRLSDLNSSNTTVPFLQVPRHTNPSNTTVGGQLHVCISDFG